MIITRFICIHYSHIKSLILISSAIASNSSSVSWEFSFISSVEREGSILTSSITKQVEVGKAGFEEGVIGGLLEGDDGAWGGGEEGGGGGDARLGGDDEGGGGAFRCGFDNGDEGAGCLGEEEGEVCWRGESRVFRIGDEGLDLGE